MMSLFERTSEDLNSSKLVLHHFNDSFLSIQSHICSIISLSEQWSNFHNSFVSIQASLAKNVKELEVKEREIDSLRSKLSNQQEEAKLVRISLNDGWKEVELRQKAVEKRENDVNARFEELGLEKKRVKELRKAVEAKAKRVEEQEKDVQEKGRSEGFEEREKAVEDREKVVEERCKAVERREKEVEERSEAVEEGENAVNKRCLEVQRREKVVQAREEEVDRRIRELEAKEEEIDERCRLTELEEKRIEERCENVGLMEREVEERCKAQELREKQLSERCEGLELKEKGLIEKLEEMEMKEKRIDERCEGLEFKEKGLTENLAEMEMREKRIDERCEGLELKEKGLIEKVEEIQVKEKHIDERCKAVELREREIDDRCKVVELKESEVDERWKEQELRDKELNERCKGLELKERRIDERLRELESKGIRIDSKLKQTDEACEKLGLKKMQLIEHAKEKNPDDKQLREMCGGLWSNNRDRSGMEMNSEPQNNVTLRQCVIKDGETLQMFLNDRVDEHKFMDEEVCNALKLSRNRLHLVLYALNGFYPPHLKKGNVEYEASVVRSSCVLLLKQLMNMKRDVSKKLTKRAKGLAFRWKEKMMEEGENQIVVLSFLLLVAAYDLRSYFEKDELQRLYEILNKDRITLQLRQELNLLAASEGSSMATEPIELKTMQLQPDVLQVTDADASSAMNHCNKVHSLCHSMDANGLRSCIGQHLMEQSFYLEKVRDALQCAPDPGKLILDVVQIFNQPGSTAVEKASCIFLLELLMKLQKQQPSLNLLGQTEQLVKPPLKITHNLRRKANELACIWKQTLSDKGCQMLEAYSFLQFVATYQLERSFKENELLQLFKLCYGENSVYRPEQNPRLCHALGLTKRIPGLINSFVKGGCRLQAIKYICTFMMESHFPLVPLLKDHLKAIEKKAVKLQKRKNCHAAKIDNARFEIRNLEVVLQYINDYRLGSKLSPVPLESRIKELEIQIAEVKTATADEEQGAIVRKEGLKDNISTDLEMIVEEGSNELEKEENISSLQVSPADRSQQSGENKRTSSPCNSLVLPKVKRLRPGDLEPPVSPNVPTAGPMNTQSGSTQLSPQPMRQPGPCTSGHQSHVRPDNLPVLPPETLPAVSTSSVQYGYPHSSKEKLEKITSHLVNETEKKLSPTPYAQTASGFVGIKQSSSPCTSLVSPQAKHLRPETLQSPFPSNIPISHPITTHAVPVNPPEPSPQLWKQPGPYSFEHQAYVRSNGPSTWHPGPWPAVNGSNAHIGVPGGNYGSPYGGTAQFNPAGTWNGQLNPAGVSLYGNSPRPGYFVGGQAPYRPR